MKELAVRTLVWTVLSSSSLCSSSFSHTFPKILSWRVLLPLSVFLLILSFVGCSDISKGTFLYYRLFLVFVLLLTIRGPDVL